MDHASRSAKNAAARRIAVVTSMGSSGHLTASQTNQQWSQRYALLGRTYTGWITPACGWRTHFDHLVGPGDDRRRDFECERSWAPLPHALKIPVVYFFAPCRAHAPNGHATLAPTSALNSRRLIVFPPAEPLYSFAPSRNRVRKFLIDFDQQQLLLLLLLCACGQRACVVRHVQARTMHAHAWIWLVEKAGLLTPFGAMDRCAAAIAPAACR